MLPPARASAHMDRREDRRGGVNARENIGDRHTRALRCAIGLTRDRHKARHPLNDVIIPCAMRIGTGLPETGDRTIDQLRILFGKTGIIQPVFCQSADFKIFDQDIGIPNQAAQLFLPLWRSKINHNASFSTVARMKIRGGLFIFTLNKRRTPLPRIIPAWGFYLNHFRAKIGEGLPGPRTSQNPRKLNHL